MKGIVGNVKIVIMVFFIFSGYGFSVQTTQDIVENVEVNWWQVPVFAVDKNGRAVTDLKEIDFEVWMNNQPVKGFVFSKRGFDLAHYTEQAAEDQGSEVKKKQVIFLLFDTAMSKAACTIRSKKVSKEIMKHSAPGTQFVLLSIEPFKGLNHVCGPTSNKKELLRNIREKIIPKVNDPLQDAKGFKEESLGGKNDSEGNLDLGTSNGYISEMPPELRSFYIRKTRSFINAFESLYIILNSIKDNKFVYFFSEGIPEDLIKGMRGGRTMFNSFIKNVAQLLGRSGIVLFVVNPVGVNDGSFLTSQRLRGVLDKTGEPTSTFNESENRSGETNLRLLAKESGGKYLEGVDKKIADNLEQFHRAYYELSFPDLRDLKGNTRNITIKPKRKGVTIHTLRALEKSKRYAQLNGIEKELTAINLISGNPLFKSKLDSQPVRVTKTVQYKKKLIFHVQLPEDAVGQQLDLYKCWLRDNKEVVSLDLSSLRPINRKIKISFNLKGKQNKALKPYFAFINSKKETALVRAVGDDWIEEENSLLAKELKPSQNKIIQSSITTQELQHLLTNAGHYCERLKQSAIHFYCKEKISELKDYMVSIPGNKRARGRRNYPSGIQSQVKNYLGFPPKRGNTRVEKIYSFSYRLLKKGEQIKEERQWLSSANKKKTTMKTDEVVKPTAFFTRRAIFAPITMLAHNRHDIYDYRFIGYENQMSRSAAVIEAIPKDQEREHSIYGKIWIDKQDYSILKIEADPRSIKGYTALIELEKKLKTKLRMSLDIEFGKLNNGLRFPTRVSMVEHYKGGRYISKLKGPRGWLRNRTVFIYNDYRFFNVNVEVTLDDKYDPEPGPPTER